VASPRVETTNLDIYGGKPLPWSRARRQLIALGAGKPKASRGSPWLATNGPRGTHLTGIGAIWVDDRWYFVSGPRTRKGRNLLGDPRCAIAVSLPDLDLVVEGTARRVTDARTLRRIARRYNRQGWPARAERGAFTAAYSAPSAGRPPWYLYALTPRVAIGVATKKPYGATRWRFKRAR
jgi:hypothetical protein